MFTPTKMCKLNVLVLRKYLKGLTRALGDSGLVHLVDAVSQSRERLLTPLEPSGGSDSLLGCQARCDRLLESLGVEIGEESDAQKAAPALQTVDAESISHLLERIEKMCQKPAESLVNLLAESTGLSTQSKTLSEFPLQNTSLLKLHSLSHFYMVTGKLAMDAFLRARQALGEQAIFIRESETSDNVLIIGSRRNRWELDESLQKFGFERIEVPDSGDKNDDSSAAQVRKALEDKLGDLERELDNCRLAMLKINEEYGDLLLNIREQIKAELDIQQAQEKFGKSNKLYCVSGWVPEDKSDDIRRIVATSTDNTGIIELIPAEEDELVKAGLDEIPVKLRSSVLTRPFQMLVTNYATPNYHEIDPSILVGITFLIMFGYMFGDVGHGLVLALLGAYLKFFRKNADDAIRDVGVMLMLCGSAGMVFGFCYGSIFGYEELFKPLWLNPMHQPDVMTLLLTSIGLGIIFLSVAILVNIINQIATKNYFEAIFDKQGVLGLVFYWGALIIGYTAKKGCYNSYLLLLVIVPLVLIFLKEIIHNLVKHHNLFNGHGAINVIIESIIETMDTLTGFMSGTISFIRVGAFAISHAALCFAVYAIVHMISGMPFHTLVSIFVIVFGNLVVIMFEGMVVTIQCLRLEYYELFSRFFQGGGKAYKPFNLKNHQ